MELDLLKPYFELKKLQKPTACYNCNAMVQPDDEYPAVADLYMKLVYKGKHVLCSRAGCVKQKADYYLKQEDEGISIAGKIYAKLEKMRIPPPPPSIDGSCIDIDIDNPLPLIEEETKKNEEEETNIAFFKINVRLWK